MPRFALGYLSYYFLIHTAFAEKMRRTKWQAHKEQTMITMNDVEPFSCALLSLAREKKIRNRLDDRMRQRDKKTTTKRHTHRVSLKKLVIVECHSGVASAEQQQKEVRAEKRYTTEITNKKKITRLAKWWHNCICCTKYAQTKRLCV